MSVKATPLSPHGRAASAPPDALGWRPSRPAVTTRATGTAYVCPCGATTESPGRDGWWWRRAMERGWNLLDVECGDCRKERR